MRKTKLATLCASVVSSALLCAGSANAALSINLATGLNGSGAVLTSGDQQDANWTVTGADNYQSSPHTFTVFSGDADWYGGWFANGPNSDWIAADPNQSDNGNMVLTRTFSLAGYNPADAVLTGGQWTIDDAGTLTLNGHLLDTAPSGDWGAFRTFTVPSSDFVAGVNTLVMTDNSDRFLEAARLEGVVTDNVAVGGVPEPGTWVMLLLGIGAVGAALRARRRKVGSSEVLA